MNNRIQVRILSSFAAMVALLTAPQIALAFKADTHVWIAQQVLNDAADGKLTFKIDGKNYDVTLDAGVVSAITSNPAMFRMGSIGPDALPDMLVGQSIVHPGSETGWKTDDWLKWLLKTAKRPEEVAFAYGYLVHAASDVFAHTYVNQYSGDIFNITDGEVEVEKRHILLEKNISTKMPPIQDSGGIPLGEAKDLIQTPDAYIADTLIFNDTVAEQYQNAGALHLLAVHKLRSSLQKTIDGPLTELEAQVISLIVEEQTGLRLNNEQIGELIALTDKFKGAFNTAVDSLQAEKDRFVGKVDDAILGLSDVEKDLADKTFEYVILNDNMIYLSNEILDEVEKLNNIPNKVLTEVCSDKYEEACKYLLGWSCKIIKKTVCEYPELINPAYAVQEKVVDDLQRALSHLGDYRDDLKQLTHTAIDTLAQAQVGLINANNDALNLAIDLGQRYTLSLNPVRSHLQGWSKDVYDGMRAYTLANDEVIRQSMISGGNMLKPLDNWLDCWGMAITMSVPAPINAGACKISKAYEHAMAALAEFEDKTLKAVGKVVPAVETVRRLRSQLMDEVKRLGENAAYRLAEHISGVPLKTLVNTVSSPASDADLNTLYATDNSGKGLLLIPDVASRINAEMALSNGKLNPDKYAPVYDATVLSKLALLSTAQLNQVAAFAGVTSSTTYGGALYSASAVLGDPVNILVGAIKSIDGNYQWMEYAPPYPRASGKPDTGWPAKRSYGYSASGGKGFRLWQDPAAREKVFRKLFKGPIAPGIEAPNELGAFTTLLDSTYPYKPCQIYGFPNLNDYFCNFIYSMPAIMLMTMDR